MASLAMNGRMKAYGRPGTIASVSFLAGKAIYEFCLITIRHDLVKPLHKESFFQKNLTTLTSIRKADWSWFDFDKQMVWEGFKSVLDFSKPLRIVKTYKSQNYRVKWTLATYSEFPMLLCVPRRILTVHSVVKFQSWALFTKFKSKNWNEVGRDLREVCCE